MSSENCYLCSKSLPSGQSYYEGQGQTVCLSCYRVHARCVKCNFPGKELKETPPHGMLCEFCRVNVKSEPSMTCILCSSSIPAGSSHYSGQNQVVCLNCFKDAKKRCFTCRFPQVSMTTTSGPGVCSFCKPSVITDKSDLKSIVAPLEPFLAGLGHRPPSEIKGVFLPSLLILGMQDRNPPPAPIEFFEEFILFAMPIVYLRGVFYMLPAIPKDWFIASMVGQMAAFDICRTYGLEGLVGDTPFHKMAQGWSHFVSFLCAQRLKYTNVERRLERMGANMLVGDFNKFLGMHEHRKPKDVIHYAKVHLAQLAKKHL